MIFSVVSPETSPKRDTGVPPVQGARPRWPWHVARNISFCPLWTRQRRADTLCETLLSPPYTGMSVGLHAAKVLRHAAMISSSETMTAFCSEGATGIGTSRVQTRWGGASSS